MRRALLFATIANLEVNPGREMSVILLSVKLSLSN